MPRLPTIDTRQAGVKPRVLVLCFDGTTNIYDETNTNVVKLFSLLKRNNREEQMVYYQPGVGTYVPPGMLLPLTLKLAKVADQAIALYLDRHVMGGYEFLMKHYNDGDKICLFGFSRGAYTARALAGMLHKVGLLPPDNVEQISFAYQMYRRSDKVGFKESAGFKKTFSREVEIEFMGVWDTVSSVGVLVPRHLPFTKSNPIVKTFRHAVSLDERRAKFRHHLWHVHSLNGQCAKSPTELESAKLPEPRFLSPTVQTISPISPAVALQPASKLRGSNLKEVIDITVTEATPSTECEITPDTAVGRSPLWAGEQADDTFLTGSREQTLKAPPSQSWHPKERTQVEASTLDVEKEAANTDRANAVLPTTKPDVSLDPAAAKEGEGAATEVDRSETRLLDRIMSRLGVDRAAKKRSTDSSGAFEYEAAMSAQFQTDKGRNIWENDVLEVWFAGCHSDVGGGAVSDSEEYQLSNISLRWMIRQIISSQCGIKFDAGALKTMHISPATVSFGMKTPSSHYSSPSDVKLVSAAQKQEMGDALAKLHDNVLKPAWWPLELFPLLHTYIDRKGDSHIKVRGRRPHTSGEKIKVHRTVQYRMNNSSPETYQYKARIAEEDIEWVD
ncbi:putative protein YEL023C [Saccharomyces cerevisiae S288c] [Rhizoctonia solani]|uniref:T6SS Phospholipase effector Tle1-like catalytic domain-containing protein n=1 Tax=Rhizoctonia solani TaxID=456999 RepID=A0A0K6GGY3_9AGAM|nr:putative protein YEL023C [Saccharomyces cerevisiae S288c] [Rhizoctonia solani]